VAVVLGKCLGDAYLVFYWRIVFLSVSDNYCLTALSYICRSSSEVAASAFAYVYSELVQYHQNRVDSISELERRLESSGYGVGLKVLELLAYRSREVRFLDSPVKSLYMYFANLMHSSLDALPLYFSSNGRHA
jgi:hypothetical protein